MNPLSAPRPRLRRATPRHVLTLLMLAAAAPCANAQFAHTTSGDTITITGYTGPSGAVTVPDTINGWPVTAIGPHAFRTRTSLTRLTLPDSVTNVGSAPFTSYGNLVEIDVDPLNSGYKSVEGVLFNRAGSWLGWADTFAGRPTSPWDPRIVTANPSLGVRTSQFAFSIGGRADVPFVVEATTDLAAKDWLPLETNRLSSEPIRFSIPAPSTPRPSSTAFGRLERTERRSPDRLCATPGTATPIISPGSAQRRVGTGLPPRFRSETGDAAG